MKNILALFLFMAMCCATASAQQFNNAYIPNDSQSPFGESGTASMVASSSGGTVSIHNLKEGPLSFNPEGYNAHVVHVDANGGLLWSTEIGGEGYDDRLFGICETDDGGFLLVGKRGKFSNNDRSWLVRLDAAGNIVWDRMYLSEKGTEHLLVQRTSEAAETYFIAGILDDSYANLNPSGFITAMKVDFQGNQLWSNVYQPADLPNNGGIFDRVTSMVEDVNKGGYVIAGLQGGNRTTGEIGIGKESGSIFTIGLRYDGSIFSPYRTYDVQAPGTLNSSKATAPHINKRGQGFIMAFGIRPQGFDNAGDLDICVMPLNPNLNTNTVIIYDPGVGRGARGHSIYDNGSGFSIGCTSDRAIPGTLSSSVGGVSYLSIGSDLEPLSYYRYAVGSNPGSSFMVKSSAGFVLNANHNLYNTAAMGLIGVNIAGDSKCAGQGSVQWNKGTITKRKVLYGPVELGTTNFQFILPAVNSFADRLNCTSFSSGQQGRIAQPSSSSTLKAYPTLIETDQSEITLEFNLEAASSVNFAVFNLQGKMIQSIDADGQKGVNNLSLSTAEMSLGMNTIIMYLNDGSQENTTRVIKF